MSNSSKVVGYETWDSNTSSWNTEIRTWNEMGTIWSNTSKPIQSTGSTMNTGTISPSTMADDATVGTVTWTNPNNAKVEDGNTAETVLNSQTSHYLKATNFGLSIPVGATINGILVEIKKKQVIDGNYIKDSLVKIVKSDGSFGTTNKADTIDYWTGTLLYSSYGSSSDLWGENWTPADINNANFGTVISAIGITTACTVYIDCIRMTVYYTTGATGFITNQAKPI